jgi:transcriptional regulator with XRE-family HTH domain
MISSVTRPAPSRTALPVRRTDSGTLGPYSSKTRRVTPWAQPLSQLHASAEALVTIIEATIAMMILVMFNSLLVDVWVLVVVAASTHMKKALTCSVCDLKCCEVFGSVQNCSFGMGNDAMNVDGARLREGRESLNYSREAFLEAIKEKTGLSVSMSTLRRAEDGECKKMATLRAICFVLGASAESYLEKNGEVARNSTMFDLNGRWKSYFLEYEGESEPYLTIENLTVHQKDTEISGTYEVAQSKHPDGWKRSTVYKMQASINMDSIVGKYYADGRKEPAGLGIFHLILSPLGDIAEGFCSIYSDEGNVMVSRNVWLRTESVDFRRQDEIISKRVEEGGILKAPYVWGST